MLHQPKYKICRRLGARVFGKCENPKFSPTQSKFKMTKRKHASQLSEFGAQLLEKQKAKYVYGLRERQFANYVKKAMSMQTGNPVEWLYKELESRLDNVVYRLGFAKTHAFAKQLVSHGHILVNGKKMTIPSYHIKPGDLISIRAGSKNKTVFNELNEKLKEHKTPPWLSVDTVTHEGTVLSNPIIGQTSESMFSLGSILEFYSR